jgi:ABC-type Mn2+/Zn2+ transport system permease subunit
MDRARRSCSGRSWGPCPSGAGSGHTAGINVARLNIFFLEIFALTVALGLRYLGVLLMGSLIIIPAATAKYVARTLTGMLVGAVVFAILATLAGVLLAGIVHKPTGPVTIGVAASLFGLSLFTRRFRVRSGEKST